MLNPTIIFEDESLFVVDKPSGFITNEAGTTTNQPVLQTWIKQNFEYELKNNWDLRDGIVHRLDKETSGILLVAKTKEAFEDLQRQFKERLVHKTYIALAHGLVDPKDGVIDETVGRLPWRRDRFGVLAGGRDAKTNYKTVENYKSQKTNEDFSLLQLEPETGRTHQIRIHLKHINHPIVGDEFYAGRKTARKDRKWCNRLFLHAGQIKFNHPITKQEVNFSSPLPSDLADILKSI